jgi:flagellin
MTTNTLALIAISLLWIGSISPQPAHANSSLDYLNHILKESEGIVDRNYNRLSGGVRLLTDDPANYAIYQKLEAQVRGFAKEIDNNKDIISFYKFGESMLGNIIDALQRIRELVIEKSNTIFSRSDLEMLDAEIGVQYDQILFVLQSAEFNKIQVFGDLFSDKLFADVFHKDQYFSLASVDRMLDFITNQRSFYGSKLNLIEHRIASQMTGRENYQSFQSTILDLDYGQETSMLAKNELLFLVNMLLLPTK